jgi:hypothetical protein
MVSIGAIVPELTEFFSDPLSYAHGHIARLDRRFETMGFQAVDASSPVL